jgi:hypothetical protein
MSLIHLLVIAFVIAAVVCKSLVFFFFFYKLSLTRRHRCHSLRISFCLLIILYEYRASFVTQYDVDLICIIVDVVGQRSLRKKTRSFLSLLDQPI